MKEIILKFCEQFRQLNATDCFLNGMCYWFAFILRGRFTAQNPIIMYDGVANHFGCKIENRIYDITGDVTEQYKWEVWLEYADRDSLETSRIYRDCILKLNY